MSNAAQMKQAAERRAAIIGALTEAGQPLNFRELFEHKAIAKVFGDFETLRACGGSMVKNGLIQKVGGSSNTKYTLPTFSSVPVTEVPKTKKTVAPRNLLFRVSRSGKTLGFEFAGLNITIEIVD